MTTLYLPEGEQHRYSGIDISWVKSKQSLDIGGWYDSFVGIQSTRMSLKEFFTKLGITELDCIKAFK